MSADDNAARQRLKDTLSEMLKRTPDPATIMSITSTREFKRVHAAASKFLKSRSDLAGLSSHISQLGQFVKR